MIAGLIARRFGRLWRALAVLAGAAIVLALAGWAVLVSQILPRIDTWRPALSQQATHALGVPVRIGAVTGRSEAGWPVLSLREVELLDEQGRVALRLPQVTARVAASTLAPWALWRGEVRLDRLVLVRPELDVRRDAAGVLHVAGLRLTAGKRGGQGEALADWVLSQTQIQIAQGTVRWTDEQRDASPMALQQLDMTLRNRAGLGRRWHELTVQATPPQAFGSRFSLEASVSQPLWMVAGTPLPDRTVVRWWRRWQVDAPRPSQWATWSGKTSASLPHVDVQQLSRHVALPVELQGGRGRIQAEISFTKGQPSGLMLDAAVQDVSVRLARGLAPLAFQAFKGRVDVTYESRASTLAFRDLAFVTKEGVNWPSSGGRIAWRHAPWSGGSMEDFWRLTQGGMVEADRLDLALLAQLADRLPLAPGLRARLADLAVQGVARDLSWRWEGLAESPGRYRADGRFEALGWAASSDGRRPGLSKADVVLQADQSGGHADVAVRQGWVDLPAVFEEPRVPLNALQARVNWTVTPPDRAGQASALAVDVTRASFSNDDARGQLQAQWRTTAGAAARSQAVANEGDAKAGANAGEGRFPGYLVLTGRLDHGVASRVWRYLPLAIPKAPREYVRLALREGHGENVNFEVRGDLAQFPFKDDMGGRFRVHVPVREVTLDYAPAELVHAEASGDTGASASPAALRGGQAVTWPAFSALDGDLVFEGQRMLIKGGRGRLAGIGSGGFRLHDVQGRIDDLASANPHLVIGGEGEGLLNDLLRFLSASPVGAWTGNMLAHAQAAGGGAMSLALDIPLNHVVDATLKGRVKLAEQHAASLRLHAGLPEFTHLQGEVGFTESTLNVHARTRVWGQDVAVDGQRHAGGAPRFLATGVMSADGLRRAEEWPALGLLAQRLSGQAPVSVSVSLSRGPDGRTFDGPPEVQITSSLQGMSAALPAPLNKPADAVWPLKVTHRYEDAQGRADALLLDLGNPQMVWPSQGGDAPPVPWLQVDLRRDVSGATPRVVRGALSLIQSMAGDATGLVTLPSKGLAAQMVVPTLDVDAWQAVARSLHANAAGQPARATHAAAPMASPDTFESYLPDNITLRTGALSYQQRILRDVSATLAHPSPGVWRAQLEAQQVAGQIEVMPETAPLAGGPSAGRVVARLSRLSVPPAEAEALQNQAVEQLLTPEAAATTLPSLDIVIDRFEWRGLPLGRIEVEAVNRLTATAGPSPTPEWRLTKFRMSTPEAQLNATGNWSALGASVPANTRRPGGAPRSRPRSAFGFTLDLQNSGGLLTRLGLPQTLRGGKGQLTGQVSWLGSPLEPDPASMTGEVAVAIKEGQFLKVDPGIAKLLGVLSLQSLPRRLALDFRDVFQEGFAFDSISGDVKITQGVASTKDLRMRGVQAVVLMEGQADLARETQDLHVFVVPDVNAGGASLAYAAINPAIGLGTFIAQVLLRKQVADAGTREFRVTGSWADPQVEKVDSDKTASPAASGASRGGPAAVTKPRKPA